MPLTRSEKTKTVIYRASAFWFYQIQKNSLQSARPAGWKPWYKRFTFLDIVTDTGRCLVFRHSFVLTTVACVAAITDCRWTSNLLQLFAGSVFGGPWSYFRFIFFLCLYRHPDTCKLNRGYFAGRRHSCVFGRQNNWSASVGQPGREKYPSLKPRAGMWMSFQMIKASTCIASSHLFSIFFWCGICGYVYE